MWQLSKTITTVLKYSTQQTKNQVEYSEINSQSTYVDLEIFIYFWGQFLPDYMRGRYCFSFFWYPFCLYTLFKTFYFYLVVTVCLAKTNNLISNGLVTWERKTAQSFQGCYVFLIEMLPLSLFSFPPALLSYAAPFLFLLLKGSIICHPTICILGIQITCIFTL